MVVSTGPVMLPGESEAIEHVVQAGKEYGYGNMIARLQEAWCRELEAKGIAPILAAKHAHIICVWCNVDSRTGKRVKS